MATIRDHSPSLRELLHRVGDVPRERIVFDPPPGTATVDDVQRLCDGDENRKCELIDGVLVEKFMGLPESWIAMWLGHQMQSYLMSHPLGKLAGPDGPYEILDNQIRFPDISFVSWERIPEDADPRTFAPDWAPNLAVEVLSPSNTRDEMQRKLQDYFTAGVELVWYIDPDDRKVEVFTGVDHKQTLTETDRLTGGAVLPGFEVSVRQLFDSGELRRPSNNG